MEQALGPSQPSLMIPYHLLAYSASMQGRPREAVRLQAHSNKLANRYLRLILDSGVEREWQRGVRALEEQTYATVFLALESGDAAAHELVLETLLQRKARLLDTMRGKLEAVRERLPPDERHLLDELSAVRTQLAGMALRGPGPLGQQAYLEETERLAARAEELEAALSAQTSAFESPAEPISVEAMRQLLPSDAALIEYVSYRSVGPKGRMGSFHFQNWSDVEQRYAACVLPASEHPRCTDLGAAAPINAAIHEFRKALGDPRSTQVKALGQQLHETLVRPLQTSLQGATMLLLSPDGELNLVPFGALVDGDGRYLIEHYSFSYLTTGRDLLRIHQERRKAGQTLILGDPAFTSNRSEAPDPGEVEVWISKLGFGRIPETATEARAVGELLPGSRVLLGAEATETALKQTDSPRILHIASHGFFLPRRKSEPPTNATDGSLVEAVRTLIFPGDLRQLENPFLRSGLALAGSSEGESVGDDGILTALEASTLDLSGTELVVLSSCDTGLGDVRSGEGVYGLRRAFVLAGSESQVSTLWRVGRRVDPGADRWLLPPSLGWKV